MHFLQFDSFLEMGKTLRIRLVEKGYIPRDFTEIYGIYTHLRYTGEYRYSWDGFRKALKSALDNNDWENIPILSAVLAHTVSNYYGEGGDQNPFDYVEIDYD